MNKVWTRASSILGFLRLLSVCPLLSDFSDSKYQVRYQDNSDNLYFKQAKYINGSNFFRAGDGGNQIADLNRWCEGQNSHSIFAKSAKFGKYGRKYER